MKKILVFTILFVCVFFSEGHEYRNLLQQKVSAGKLKDYLVPERKWVSYPDYADRKGWDELTGNVKDENNQERGRISSV